LCAFGSDLDSIFDCEEDCGILLSAGGEASADERKAEDNEEMYNPEFVVFFTRPKVPSQIHF
jgi:hypothetical protein